MITMENDRRARRTKTLLKNAYIELLQEKKFTEISVKELCELADINRGTFYLHYNDIYDLKTQLEDDIMNQLEELVLSHASLNTSDDTYQLFLQLFQFTEKNQLYFSAFLGENGDISYFKRMQGMFKDLYLGLLLQGKTPSNSTNLDYSYNFIASGFTGLIENWLSNSKRPAPEEMAILVNRILYEGLPSLLSFL